MRKKNKLLERIYELFGKLFGYILVFISILLIISLVRNIKKVKEAQSRIDKVRERVEKLKKENEELSKQAEAIQAEEFIEKQLRDKLGLAKPGEIVLVLPDAETLRKLSPQIPEEEETLPDPNWRKWLHLFL